MGSSSSIFGHGAVWVKGWGAGEKAAIATLDNVSLVEF